MKKNTEILNILKVITLFIYILIGIDLIVATIVFGLNCIHLSACMFVVFSAFCLLTTHYTRDSKAMSFLLIFLSVVKTIVTLFSEILMDLVLNAYNFVDDGIKFLIVLFYIIFVVALFIVEIVYAVVNIVTLYKGEKKLV